MILDILDKACPQCGATNPSINSRCACGYLYPKDLRLALERDVQQEKTLEKNLAARAEKAAATAGLVAQIAAAEPQNRSKAAAAVKAERTAVAGQVELATLPLFNMARVVRYPQSVLKDRYFVARAAGLGCGETGISHRRVSLL